MTGEDHLDVDENWRQCRYCDAMIEFSLAICPECGKRVRPSKRRLSEEMSHPTTYRLSARATMRGFSDELEDNRE